MTILVTGGSGFSGKHLVCFLLKKMGRSDRLMVLSRRPRSRRSFPRDRRLAVQCADLRKRAPIQALVRKFKPDEVYHLAAFVKNGRRALSPAGVVENNVRGTAHLLEALHRHAPRARVLNVGSSYQYGRVSPARMPIRETYSEKPCTSYALSKTYQEAVARHYQTVHGMAILYTRTFYYAGPGQPLGFFLSNRVREMKQKQRAKNRTIEILNPGDRTDYTDIRDVARAYHALMKHGKTGEVYNVCSSVARPARRYFRILEEISRVRYSWTEKRKRHGPLDRPFYAGSNAKIRKATGWKPLIPIEQTLRDMWRTSWKTAASA